MSSAAVGGRRWEDEERRAAARLAAAGIANAAQEARWLIEEVGGSDRRRGSTDVGPGPEPAAEVRLEMLVARRVRGEPLQYVIGHWPFRTLDLIVDDRALVPRPETEQVTQCALDELAASGLTGPLVVDLGTGSGAIALSIAVEHPAATVVAVDRSAPALELARENRKRVGLDADRVAFHQGSWFEPLPGSLRGAIDLIVTNPPYVADDDEVERVVADWEPATALEAGPDGLDALRTIIAAAPEWLAHHGVLVAEIGASQAAAVELLAARAGFARHEVRKDLAGRARMLIARR